MKGKKKIPVEILRCGNRIVIDPTTPRIKRLLAPQLSYVTKNFFRGRDAYLRKEAGLLPFEEEEWECWAEDHRGRLGTSFGFVERITKILTDEGYPVTLRYASDLEAEQAKERETTVYRQRWDKIEEFVADGFEFKYRQKKALKLLANSEHGRIWCPPAWGKGTEIMLFCKLMSHAKIAIVVRSVDILQQRLYPELAANLPSVGMVGGGRKIKDRRVMLYTFGSLQHAKGDEDIVLVDEGHQACADDAAYKMGIFEHARIYGFSATWDMRLDNKDLRGEAMFGPVLLKISYEQCVKAGLISPIKVIWRDVIMDVNPCAELLGTDKKREGIWHNEYRNQLIAEDARSYTNDEQILITVETIEHAFHLKKELPEFKLVYAPDSLELLRLRDFKRDGIVPEGFKILTHQKKYRIAQRFSAGDLRKVIATPVWNVGVNFVNLDVLIRGDAGGSPTNDTQIPGRNSRKNETKVEGIVHDYRDQFDHGSHMKAKGRESSYEKNQWKQYILKRGRLQPLRRKEEDD